MDNPVVQKLVVIGVAVIPFAVLGWWIYRELFTKTRRLRESNTRKLQQFQQQCCDSLTEQARLRGENVIGHRVVTDTDGKVTYVPIRGDQVINS